jgi:cellulose synthase operon protein C
MNIMLSKPYLFALGGLLSLLLVGCSTPEEKAASYYKSGQAFLDQQDYARASVEFRNALKIKKDDPDSWFGMAQIEEHAQNWPTMVGDLNKVIEINPNHVKAYLALTKFYMLAADLPNALKNVNLANDKDANNPDIISLKAVILLKLNDAKGARAETESALKLNPNHANANIVLASLQLNEGNQVGALATVEKSILSNPKALGLYLVKMKIFEKQADLVGQEAVIRDIIKLFPDQREYQNGLISFLLKNNRADDAEKELRDNLAANPKDKQAGLMLVKMLMDTKGPDVARSQLEELAKASEEPFKYQLQIADIDYASGRKDDSYANLRKLIARAGISDDGMEARLDLAGKLLDERQLTEVETLVGEVLKNDTLNANGMKLRGALELAKGNKDAAIEVLRQALNNSADDPSLHIILANAYESKLSFDLANKELSDAYRLSKGDPEIGITLASFLLRRGSADRAEEILSEIVSRSPNSNSALVMLANIKLEKQDWKGAEDIAKMVQDNEGDNSISNQIMGASMIGQQRFNDAISFFQSSFADAPDNVQPMFALVRSYIGAGNIDEAEKFVQSILKANPNNAKAYIMMSVVQVAKKFPQAAQKNLETAISLDPTSDSGYLALAQFYFNQKDITGAISTLKGSLDKVKNNINLRLVLGGLYESQDAVDKAIEQYQAVVDVDPASVAAVNNLVSLTSDYSTDAASLNRAVVLAEVLKSSPIPQFRETFGWLMVQNGNAKAGLQVLEQTITKLDGYSMAHYHIGVAYAKVGDKLLAEQHLTRAMNSGTDTAVRDKIGKALQSLKDGTL